jgi:hypothetical protein
MPTQPRRPRHHYAEAERLIRATEETPGNAVLLAIAHALLAAAPRRARRREPEPAHRNGGSPQERWLRGDG